ncbi:MAG: sulfatase-like hydrolase/transferase, partial [Sporomusaceae bacterium]|nr:sulfatase-like hydrolase/transferase [Sporomusaceae bacterium]
MSTISGVMGILTGMADANLYLTYLPESYKEPYSTAIAPQMKELGYKARFWYAGPNSWEKIKDFALAQGFDEFYGMGDIESQSGNIWGCDDKYLFKAVDAGLNKEEPSFNIVLNTSNHAPYTVNLEEEGFDEASVISGLPEHLKQDKELIKKLGHFWYADKVMTEFVQRMRSEHPDSLFIIVGDHADRLNLDLNPSLYERYGIPFILYGQGVTKQTLPENAAGSHINVTPTLLELIAPSGFVYHSLGDSLTRGNTVGFNYGFWMTHDYVSKIGGHTMEQIPRGYAAIPPNEELVQQDIDARRAMSWWRGKYGKNIN